VGTYVGVPVKLPKTARLQSDKGGREGLGRGEVGRVNLVKGATATGDLLARMRESAVHETRVS